MMWLQGQIVHSLKRSCRLMADVRLSVRSAMRNELPSKFCTSQSQTAWIWIEVSLLLHRVNLNERRTARWRLNVCHQPESSSSTSSSSPSSSFLPTGLAGHYECSRDLILPLQQRGLWEEVDTCTCMYVCMYVCSVCVCMCVYVYLIHTCDS